MTKYIKTKDGKFAGSIGTGKTKTPTAAPTAPTVAPTATSTSDFDTQLHQGVALHFASRCYPPVPQSMVPAGVDAIKAVANGEPEKNIALPTGASWRGEPVAPAREIVSAHRLDDHVQTYRDIHEITITDASDELGSCDECGQTYELGNSTDHCPECGTCWEHCTYGGTHYYDH